MNNPVSANEQELYDWLLEQRILLEADALEPDKIVHLNANIAGWDEVVTDNEFGHALAADHAGLNTALEIWWNAKGLSSSPLTFAEIRIKAALEM